MKKKFGDLFNPINDLNKKIKESKIVSKGNEIKNKINSKINNFKVNEVVNETADATVVNPKFLKENRAKNSKVKIIVTNPVQFKELISELQNYKEGSNFTLNIGGGALLGLLSYSIGSNIIKSGIKVNEFIGNSAGSVVAFMLSINRYGDEYKKYLLEGLNDYSVSQVMLGISSMIMAKLLPFLINVKIESEKIDIIEIFMNNPNVLTQEMLKVKQKYRRKSICSLYLLKLVLINGLNTIGYKKYYLKKDDVYIEKITFLDIKNKYGNDLSLFGSFINLSIKNKIFKPIIFTGNYPVFDGLYFSTLASGFDKGKYNGEKGFYTDGFYASKQFAYEENDFQSKNNFKILIQTDTTSGLAGFVVLPGLVKIPSYGVNDFVISPDVGFIDSFNYKNLDIIEKLISDYDV